MAWPFAQKSSAPLVDVPATSPSPGTRFAFNLFRELTTEDGSNVFFSPSSVMLCLAMVYELSSGETRQAMAKALEIAGLDPVDTKRTIDALKSPFCWHGQVEVLGANSLWCNDRVQVRPEFAANLRELYQAELTTLDFASADAVPRINAWVSEKTKGKISRILDALPPLAAMIAINAVYFKGPWIMPFLREMTQDGLFTTATGQKKQLPMMRQLSTYAYSEDHESQAIVLPYEGSMAMHVILPAAHTDLRQFQMGLTSGAWENRLTQFEKVQGIIQMPRFKLDCRQRLEPALKALGMERAFDQNRAEFSGIEADPPVWIEQVLHRAVAEVNEEGTEAAAATDTVGFFSSEYRPKRQFRMILDRPFFLVIHDERTGTILFMGWVGDPESAAPRALPPHPEFESSLPPTRP